MSTKALITGITGFAGGYLRKHLENAGYEVTGITHDSKKAEKNIHLADITEIHSLTTVLEKVQPDHIYHLAALSAPGESFGKDKLFHKVNCEGVRNLLKATSSLPVKPRILFVSSAEVYGSPAQDSLPLTESSPLCTINPYAKAKLEAEGLVQEFIEKEGLDIRIARPFNHYGIGQAEKFALPCFLRQVAEIEKGLHEPVLSVGFLAPKRDYTSVKDVVRAYRLIMEQGETGEVYNICSGFSYSMEHYLKLLCSFCDLKISVVTDQDKIRPTDVMDNRGCNEKLAKMTGWRPEISLEDGLREVHDYYYSIASS